MNLFYIIQKKYPLKAKHPLIHEPFYYLQIFSIRYQIWTSKFFFFVAKQFHIMQMAHQHLSHLNINWTLVFFLKRKFISIDKKPEIHLVLSSIFNQYVFVVLLLFWYLISKWISSNLFSPSSAIFSSLIALRISNFWIKYSMQTQTQNIC